MTCGRFDVEAIFLHVSWQRVENVHGVVDVNETLVQRRVKEVFQVGEVFFQNGVFLVAQATLQCS